MAPSPTSATGSSARSLAGKSASVLGDPDQPHTYTYIPDIGEGLAVLGEHSEAPGEIWHLPNDPDTKTTRQLVEIIFRDAGRPATKLKTVPTVVLKTMGLFNPTMRELLEMQYLYAEPFVVDSTQDRDPAGRARHPGRGRAGRDPGELSQLRDGLDGPASGRRARPAAPAP